MKGVSLKVQSFPRRDGRGEAQRRVIHTTVEGIMITVRQLYYSFLVIVDG